MLEGDEPGGRGDGGYFATILLILASTTSTTTTEAARWPLTARPMISKLLLFYTT